MMTFNTLCYNIFDKIENSGKKYFDCLFSGDNYINNGFESYGAAVAVLLVWLA